MEITRYYRAKYRTRYGKTESEVFIAGDRDQAELYATEHQKDRTLKALYEYGCQEDAIFDTSGIQFMNDNTDMYNEKD